MGGINLGKQSNPMRHRTKENKRKENKITPASSGAAKLKSKVPAPRGVVGVCGHNSKIAFRRESTASGAPPPTDQPHLHPRTPPPTGKIPDGDQEAAQEDEKLEHKGGGRLEAIVVDSHQRLSHWISTA